MSSSGSRHKRYLGPVLRFGIAALILVCLVLYVARSWRQLTEEQVWQLGWGWLVASTVLLVAAQAIMFGAWHVALFVMGGSAPLALSARSYWVSQLAKYVPGKVMTVVTRAYVLKEAKVREETAVAAIAVEVAMMCIAAVMVGAACVPFVPSLVERLAPPWLAVVALIVPLALLVVHPRLLAWLMNAAARALKRDRIELATSYPQLLLVAAVFCGAWIVLGASFALLVQGLGYGRPPLAPAIGGYALSWAIGFLAFTPGGLGAREVVLTAVVALALPEEGGGGGATAAAAVVALVARLQLTMCEVLWASALSLHHRLVTAASRRAMAAKAQEGGES